MPLCAIAEVGNTFGEQKPYLLRRASDDGVFRLTAPKHFYVSPFSALDLTFEFTLRVPGDRLDVQINERGGDSPVLFTSVRGARSPLTALNLAWMSLKYPLITLKVIGLIHAHAAVLWFKRVPWHRKRRAQLCNATSSGRTLPFQGRPHDRTHGAASWRAGLRSRPRSRRTDRKSVV